MEFTPHAAQPSHIQYTCYVPVETVEYIVGCVLNIKHVNLVGPKCVFV